MKTEPMKHQIVGAELLAKHDYFMLACEMGLGKTRMMLEDAENRFLADKIDGVLVVAPNGVHTNWTRKEIPTHLSVPYKAESYVSGASKRLLQRIEKLLVPRDPYDRYLRVLTMSIDAINTAGGLRLAARFLRAIRAIMVIDESSRIKNMDAKRTQRCLQIAPLAEVRRCASGTAISNSPADVFAQFEFLEPGLLGTTSYRAFAAEYTQMLPPNNRLVLDVVARRNPQIVAEYKRLMQSGDDIAAADCLRRIARFAPQIAARDVDGKPKCRNLDKLNALMKPHMYRVTKADCLDLPDKIFQTQFFELSAAQRRAYDFIDNNMRWERADGEIDIFNALTKLTKLQQITSGFMIGRDGDPFQPYYEEANATARLAALLDVLEDIEGKFIVWARYREEIASVCTALRNDGYKVVEYHGGISKAEREEAIDSLQDGDADAFVGSASSGGLGLTLTKAETVIYYSNDFSLENRLQSEDRAHRIGTTKNVLYIDLVATDTIDEKIATALQAKQEIASIIMGDQDGRN